MFDLNSQDGSVRKREYNSPVPGGEQPGPQSTPPDKLDGAGMLSLHRRMLGYYVHELDRQYGNRLERAQDDDFYDNIQWSPEDERELEDRGQKALVYNVISASVDWITNTEKRTAKDFKVLPRRKEGSKPAQRKTELLKYFSDVNHTAHNSSRAFEDAVRSGLGWVEDGVQEDTEGEPIYSRYVNWREMLHDSRSTQFDMEDARYLFRSKWVDLDIACSVFPKRTGLLESSALESDNFLGLDSFGDEVMDHAELADHGFSTSTSDMLLRYQRHRIRMIEGWLRIPVAIQRMKGGTFHGEVFDAWSDGHRWSLAEERGAQLVSKVQLRMHVAIFTPTGMLWFSESPYRHNKFPYTPVWGKRRARDGQAYGVIRGLKGMQEDINKRASKALYIMSTNKVIMDDNALPPDTDIDEFRAEVARPDAIIVKTRGTELKLDADNELSQYQLEYMGREIQMIQQASGVTDELLGRKTNAVSGRAIERRQDQGSLATAGYFVNYRLAKQLQGEKQLSLVEQFVTEEKAFRITNSRGNPEYVTVNDGDPDNDIVRTKADFIIDEADWHATLRQAAVDELTTMIGNMGNPQLQALVLDLVVENMDIPNKDEIVKRIRAATGMKDPDADPAEITPEEQQQEQAKQAQAAMQQRAQTAEIAKVEATAAKLMADAEKILASVAELRAKTTSTNVDAAGKAMEVAAASLALPPAAVHVADAVLEEAGFVSPQAAQQQLPAPVQPPVGPEAIASAPGLAPTP